MTATATPTIHEHGLTLRISDGQAEELDPGQTAWPAGAQRCIRDLLADRKAMVDEIDRLRAGICEIIEHPGCFAFTLTALRRLLTVNLPPEDAKRILTEEELAVIREREGKVQP
jgi:hypothetical protein